MNTIYSRQQKDIFRLSTMLYKDENYNAGRDSIIRKIVETVFLEDNSKKTVFEIVQLCEENYGLIFGDDEIEEVINKNLDKFEVKREGLNNTFKIQLTERRTNVLDEHNTIDIDKYIEKYVHNELGNNSEINAKEIIYKFLYEMFTSSHTSYQHFFNKQSIKQDISIDNKNYNEDEKKIINGFLNFDDFEKDRAIFNIVSVSLEYCILTGDSKQIYVEGIRNKVFYLDSNIIYRVIGINGSAMKKLTFKFLNKCKENNIELIISKHAQEEFERSTIYHINKIDGIDGYEVGKASPKVYKCYNSRNDMYSFYYEWCSNKMNRDIELFRAYINTLYSQFLDEFKIKIDYDNYFDEDDKELNQIFSSIRGFKGNPHEGKSDKIIEFDAKNIMSLKKVRKNNKDLNRKLMETRYYLISTDEVLKEWDYFTNRGMTPLVLLPSEWLAIMLRFVGRTSDDYKSFVSFLSLKQNGDSIDSEKLHAILGGISELVAELDNQKKYAKEIIELKAGNIISMDNPSEIYSKTIEYVGNDLEQSLKGIKNEIEEAKRQLAVTEDSIESDYINKILHVDEVSSLSDERDSYKKQLINKNVDEKMKRWTNIGYLSVIILIIIGGWFLLHFFWIDEKYNFFYSRIVPYIESIPDYGKESFSSIDYGLGALLSLFFSGQAYNRLCKKSPRYIERKAEVKKAEIEIANKKNKNLQ